jgi:gas vesicle protein
MNDSFDRHGDHASGSGFMLGLLTGTVLGAGLGILLAPKSGSELRSQIGGHAASLGRAAGEQLRKVGESSATEARGSDATALAAGAAPGDADTGREPA